MIDYLKIRENFLIYKSNPNLVYLDSAASSLKLKSVSNTLKMYYDDLGVNVHRGNYDLTDRSTTLYEKAREDIASFINANRDEIIFTKGTTMSLNIIAHGYQSVLNKDDEVITSILEHHSSLLPWQVTTKKTNSRLLYIPLDNNRITIENFKSVLSKNTKVVALTHISNVMGYLTPIKEIIRLSHEVGAIVILDAAQSIAHLKIDVKDLDVDYLCFSGHKMFGPTGVGVLYGKKELLNKLEPFEYGGEMADEVFDSYSTYKEPPAKFEAGTPVIADAIGLGEAIKFISSLDMKDMKMYLEDLRSYLVRELSKIEDVFIYNKDAEAPIVTFNIDGVHPHDAATILNDNQVYIRSGQHCAQLITKALGHNATLRASLQIYNSYDDCNKLVEAVKKVIEFFK